MVLWGKGISMPCSSNFFFRRRLNSRPTVHCMIGLVVRLSDSQEAAVVANHPEAPCKPTVRVLKEGPKGPLASTRQLDLRMCRDLSIAEVDGVNVEPYLYTGEFEPESVSAA